MRALFLLCTLKKSPARSNTEALSEVLIKEFDDAGVTSEIVRLVDLNILPGVKTDEGEGDDWPAVHQQILDADIVVFATPTWLGQASSICQRALERMDAMIDETRDDGTPVAYGKVAGVVITGNEDGAHHIVGTTVQSLVDIGFSVPGHGWTYWHLGPGAGPDYIDEPKGHDYSDRVGRNAAHNLVALAKALKAVPLPRPEMGED